MVHCMQICETIRGAIDFENNLFAVELDFLIMVVRVELVFFFFFFDMYNSEFQKFQHETFMMNPMKLCLSHKVNTN